MPYYMYVSLQDDDKILVLTMDARTGKLTPKGEVPVLPRWRLARTRKLYTLGIAMSRGYPAFGLVQIPVSLRRTGRYHRRLLPLFCPQTAAVGICCPPIIKVPMQQCTLLEMTER
mgnify:CR=1 FL=1